jgi:hypothetical protein
MLASLHVCLILSILHASYATPLRVGCLAGKPPYVDVVAGKCVGLLADAFFSIMQSSGLKYTMSFVNSTTLATLAQGRPTCKSGTLVPAGCIVSSSDIPSIMFHTDNSSYDIGITFTFVNAFRLKFVDTSIPLVETDYTVLVDERFAPNNAGSLADAVMRPVVIYLFSIILLFAFMLTVVYFVSEMTLVRNTSQLRKIKYRSARLRVCFVAAIESVFTFSSPLELRSPLSMVLLTVSNYVMIFLIGIFTALITSQLTASKANIRPPVLSAMAGARIGIQGVLLKSFVAGPRMNAVPIVYDTLDGAVAGFYGDNPDRLDGVATQTDIINYFQAAYVQTSTRNTAQTVPFTATGSPEPRGYLLSRELDPDTVERFNIALQRLRESGQLAAFIAADIPGSPPPDSSDIFLPAFVVRAVYITAVAAACAMGGVFLMLLLYDATSGRLFRPRRERVPKAPDDSGVTVGVGFLPAAAASSLGFHSPRSNFWLALPFAAREEDRMLKEDLCKGPVGADDSSSVDAEESAAKRLRLQRMARELRVIAAGMYAQVSVGRERQVAVGRENKNLTRDILADFKVTKDAASCVVHTAG